MTTGNINYWLFQVKPKQFRLREALRADALKSFEVRAHKEGIQRGDKVIIWQTDPEGGCYALATVTSEVSDLAIPDEEWPFFSETVEAEYPRVLLQIDYNLWSRPVTRNLIPETPPFDEFYAGLPGVNYRATQAQYEALVKQVKEMDLVLEPEIEYEIPDWNDPPLNLILYGPPGTGKTYQTVNHALSIIENRSLEELALEDRLALRRRFNEYQNAGQIAFVSFHPSFAYEDFVEGIKAATINGMVIYTVEDGVFKIMCDDARRCLFEAFFKEEPHEEHRVVFDQLYKAFLDYLQSEDFDTFHNRNGKPIFLHRVMRYGNITVRPSSSFSVSTIQKPILQKLYTTFNMSEEVESLDQIRPVIGRGNAGAYLAVFQSLKEFEGQYLDNLTVQEATGEPGTNLPSVEVPLISRRVLANCRKYVLIIDEINRANLPALFGDLISLLEPDKREGRPEALTTILPYSKQFFGIPPNLYLIGTMNTADRTAEALDLALRRRFQFLRVPAQPDLLGQQIHSTIDGIDLAKMLKAINLRLEYLLGADYAIGHAYFIAVVTLNDLIEIFEKAIIPLLEDYFFNDYAKIGLVLGSAFVIESSLPSSDDSIFSDFEHPYSDEYYGQKRYHLRPRSEWSAFSFLRIYDKQ